MKIKDIKEGQWYETKLGQGKVIRVGGTHPPSVQMMIVAPIPRGKCNLVPRDVIEELPADVAAAAEALLK